MSTNTGGQSLHQRAPRTPESYFNVPESIALLNIVKSDRIQSAFQSNRKNHASVWEMVADILNRYNNRKRSSKQCCNRYENLKKIYTQLKRNPEKHVRRNWPYMYLFRQIEEQRGESWGSANKRRAELSYYQRRRALMLMNNSMQHSTSAAELCKIDTTSNNNKEQPLFLPNHFVQTEIRDVPGELLNQNLHVGDEEQSSGGQGDGSGKRSDRQEVDLGNEIRTNIGDMINGSTSNQLNLNNFGFGGLMNIKDEPPEETDYDDHDKDLQFGRINNNYNGQPELYMNGQMNGDIERNILHPDVIVDTDHVTDSSISNSISGSKRKLSTSSDEDSTNYELIEYLKRREKRDEEMFKRMEEREERLIRLLERTVVAIERIASQNSHLHNNNNNNNNKNNNSSNFNNKTTQK